MVFSVQISRRTAVDAPDTAFTCIAASVIESTGGYPDYTTLFGILARLGSDK
jgi:hypothetical protein